jgi:hypothetical protein
VTALLSLFANDGGKPLTKVYQRVHGSLTQNQSPLLKGTVSTLAVETAADLAALCATCGSHQALGLGVCDGNDVPVVAEALLPQNPTAITRSLQNFYFMRQPTWALIDTDGKDLGGGARDALKQAGSVWAALELIEPQLQHVAHVRRLSASSSLTDWSGKRLLSGGAHTYLLIDDGTRMRDVLLRLHRRCWAAGLGWVRISASGQMLERSLVDVSVASPERIVNEGSPIALDDFPGNRASLKIDMSLRMPRATEGEALRCGDLQPIDDAVHTALVEAERERRRDAALTQALKHFSSLNLTRDEVEALAISIAYGHRCYALPLAFTLCFKRLGWVSVEDVLDNPTLYVSPSKNSGPTLLDPLEPSGRDFCARLYRGQTDGSLFIRSWMHGETYYMLAPHVRDARLATAEGADLEYEDLVKATAS